jgi:hypothetical protein
MQSLLFPPEPEVQLCFEQLDVLLELSFGCSFLYQALYAGFFDYRFGVSPLRSPAADFTFAVRSCAGDRKQQQFGTQCNIDSVEPVGASANAALTLLAFARLD